MSGWSGWGTRLLTDPGDWQVAALRRPVRYYGEVDGAAMRSQPGETPSRIGIIGAGPAGAATALRLGQLGVPDVVLVDRDEFPRDKTCGSGVSPKGIQTLKRLGVWDLVERHAYWIRGVRLVTPRDRELCLSGGDSTSAVICNRRTLDEILLQQARALGVRFLPRFQVTALLREGERVVGFAARDGREVRAACTVVADGAHSVLSPATRSRRLMQTIMGWWDHVPFQPHTVEMVFDRMVTPGYGWLFPENETRVSIGICYEDTAHERNARRLFERFLAKHYADRLAAATAVGRWKGHPIAYRFRVGRLSSPGRLAVGEAGGFAHPATAEGIYQGMHSGILAGEALAAVAHGQAEEPMAFAAYESRCRRAFQRSFQGARLWRAALWTPLPDWIVALIRRPGLQTAVGRLMAGM